VISYRGRSAIRDVGKAMGLSLDQRPSPRHALRWTSAAPVDDQVRELGLDPTDPPPRTRLKLADETRASRATSRSTSAAS
jgi:error-prone DNA polymerase